jgi:UDP-N-acetylglucosamine transferase subunit ALG13
VTSSARRDTGDVEQRPLVVVAVGTDHHPFDRLVGWVDRWLARGGADRVECVVQHGTAAAPRWGTGVAYLDHNELRGLFARAAVVVCHAGPATVVECRRLGRVPIVVPRRPEYGEHVDNHQVLFSTRLASSNLVELAGSEDELSALLDEGTADQLRFAVGLAADNPLDATIRRFEQLVSQLAPAGPGR